MKLFESGAMLVYLAEKHGRFLSTDPLLRAETMNWLFWQMAGQGPMTGNFGHFFVYAPADKIEAREYGIARYGMEVLRLTDVLDKHLSTRTYIVGNEYSIADIAIYPWYDAIRGETYKHKASGRAGGDFLSTREKFPHVEAWANRIAARPAVARGMTVCHFTDGPKPWLKLDQQA